MLVSTKGLGFKLLNGLPVNQVTLEKDDRGYTGKVKLHYDYGTTGLGFLSQGCKARFQNWVNSLNLITV